MKTPDRPWQPEPPSPIPTPLRQALVNGSFSDDSASPDEFSGLVDPDVSQRVFFGSLSPRMSMHDTFDQGGYVPRESRSPLEARKGADIERVLDARDAEIAQLRRQLAAERCVERDQAMEELREEMAEVQRIACTFESKYLACQDEFEYRLAQNADHIEELQECLARAEAELEQLRHTAPCDNKVIQTPADWEDGEQLVMWREECAKLEEAIASKERASADEIARLAAENAKLREKLQDSERTAAALRGQSTDAQREIDTLTRRNGTLQGEVDTLRERARTGAGERHVEDLRREVVALKEEICAEVRRGDTALSKELSETIAELADTRSQLQRTEAERDELRAQMSEVHREIGEDSLTHSHVLRFVAEARKMQGLTADVCRFIALVGPTCEEEIEAASGGDGDDSQHSRCSTPEEAADWPRVKRLIRQLLQSHARLREEVSNLSDKVAKASVGKVDPPSLGSVAVRTREQLTREVWLASQCVRSAHSRGLALSRIRRRPFASIADVDRDAIELGEVLKAIDECSQRLDFVVTSCFDPRERAVLEFHPSPAPLHGKRPAGSITPRRSTNSPAPSRQRGTSPVPLRMRTHAMRGEGGHRPLCPRPSPKRSLPVAVLRCSKGSTVRSKSPRGDAGFYGIGVLQNRNPSPLAMRATRRASSVGTCRRPVVPAQEACRALIEDFEAASESQREPSDTLGHKMWARPVGRVSVVSPSAADFVSPSPLQASSVNSITPPASSPQRLPQRNHSDSHECNSPPPQHIRTAPQPLPRRR